MRLTVLLAVLAGCATNATRFARPAPELHPVWPVSAATPSDCCKALHSFNGTVAERAAPAAGANAASSISFESSRSTVATASLPYPFWLAAMAMPPVVQTRQAAAGSSRAVAGGGMSAFFRHMMGVRAANEPCASCPASPALEPCSSHNSCAKCKRLLGFRAPEMMFALIKPLVLNGDLARLNDILRDLRRY